MRTKLNAFFTIFILIHVVAASSEASELLDVLSRRLMSAHLEDFELDKAADFLEGSVGQRNSLTAILLLQIYEVMCFKHIVW